MSVAGILGVKITAEDAELRAVMKSAAKATTTAFNQMQAAAGKFKTALGFVGVGLGIREAFRSFDSAIEAADTLNDLSKKTAISVETLSGLRLAAEQSGTSMETLAKALAKLGKAQNAAADGDEKMQSMFKILKLDGKSAEEQLFAIAKAFESLSEDERVQVADRLGKGFRELIPLLSEGEAELRRTVAQANLLNPITKELAKSADQYKDSTTALSASLQGFWIALAANALPAMNQIASSMLTTSKNSGILKGALVGLGETVQILAVSMANLLSGGSFSGRVESVLADKIQALRKDIADVQAQVDSGFLKPPGKDNGILSAFIPQVQLSEKDKARLRLYIADSQKKLQALVDTAALYDPPKPAAATKPKGKDTTLAKQICEDGGGSWNGTACVPRGEAQALRKKMLDQEVKSLELNTSEARDALAERNQLLNLYNSENLISQQHYFRERERAEEEALARQIENFDAEIRAREKFRDASSGPGSDALRAEQETKILEARAKKQKALDEARVRGVTLPIEEEKALRALDTQISAVTASVLEWNGALREAAAIRFDTAHYDLKLRLTKENNQEALAELALLREQALVQADLNRLGQDASVISDRRANAEAGISRQRSRGDIDTISSLQAITAARQRQIADLQKVYESMKAIAEQNPGNAKMQQELAAFGNSLDDLKEKADALKEAFDQVFGGSFTDNLADFISGTKTAKDAFKSFVDDVSRQLSRLAAQDISNAIFKPGSSGGILSWLGGMFSGGGGSGGSGAGMLDRLGSWFSGLFGGGGAGGSGGEWIRAEKGAAFDSRGVHKFAGGGVFTMPTNFKFAGGAGLMGESGPEAVMPLARDRSGRLGVRGGSTTNNVVFNISTPDANSFRQSEAQIAARMHGMLARSNRSR